MGLTLLAVTGHPVLHSRSPLVFQHVFGSRGIDAWYTRLGATTAASALSLARRMRVAGLNVTSPFKEEIFRLAARHDEASGRLLAANGVQLEAGGQAGAFNTDPDGVRFALARAGIDAAAQDVVVVGAGGAGAAAASALATSGARVIVVNRSAERARLVASRTGCGAAGLGGLAALVARADGLVSCLPAGVEAIDEAWLRPGLWVLDANYARSPLAAMARRRGATVLDGLDWLAGQAAGSYGIFAGRGTDGGRRDGGASLARGFSPVWDADVPGEEIAHLLREPSPDAGRAGVAVAGMMGCGKSTVGVQLAARLGGTFADIDEVIAERAGHDIPWLFAHEGEEAFRRLEAESVRRVVEGGSQIVALGGGSLVDTVTAGLVRSRYRVVWLWASPACLARRTAADGRGRPLLEGGGVEARLADLLSIRTPSYARASDLVVDGERTVEETVELIAFEMSDQF